jgi:hypothetical protein
LSTAQPAGVVTILYQNSVNMLMRLSEKEEKALLKKKVCFSIECAQLA